MAERITLYKSENSIQSDIGLLKPDKLYRSADKKFWLMVEIGEYDGVCPILSADNFEHLDSLQDGTLPYTQGQMAWHWVLFNTILKFQI